MKRATVLFATAVGAVATLSIAGCGDTTEPAVNLFNDSTTTLDIAASSGDAMATSVSAMIDNEAFAGGAADYAGSSASLDVTPANVNWTRNKTCLAADGTTVANCLPFSSVRKIIIQATLSASRSGTSQTNGGDAATWTGAVHRSANDTTTRNFTNTTETSRTHNGNSTAHDTTTFTDSKMSRLMAEVAHDSVKSIVFNLPHSQNPWPASGSIVRVDSVHVEITASNKSVSKDVVRTVSIAFPADAQGNVVLTVNAKTCNLNLVTHVVSACH